MTKHLQTQTLDRDQEFAAAYYNRGAGMAEDEVLRVMATRVADGRMDFGQAQAQLMDNWMRTPGADLARWDEKETEFAKRLSEAALTLAEGKPIPVQIGVLRPDMHPLALKGLGLDDGKPLDDSRINALLSGHRADGKPIEASVTKRHMTASLTRSRGRSSGCRRSARSGCALRRTRASAWRSHSRASRSGR